ncbi:MAG: hypothetical protein AAF696_16760 [Bacteroidota bacterium]
MLAFKLCFLSIYGQGQESIFKKHKINFRTGVQQEFIKDLNYSPLRYKGTAWAQGVSYQHVNDKRILSLDLDYASDTIRSIASPFFDTNFIKGHMHLAYLKKLMENSQASFSLYAGAQYSFFINYLDWENQTSFSFLANHSLDLKLQAGMQFSSLHSLTAQLSLPLLNLIVRPPYNGFDAELDQNNEEGRIFALITDGKWRSLNSLFAYDLRLAYAYMLSDSLAFTLSYQQHYYLSELSFSYRNFAQSFSLGLKLNL